MGSSWTCFGFHTPSVPGWVDREPQHRSWKRAKLNVSQIVKNGKVWLTMTAYIVIFVIVDGAATFGEKYAITKSCVLEGYQ